LDTLRFALPLDGVARIVRAAAITPLPRAPQVVAGALDLGGRILPVFDLRRRLHLPDRAPSLDDQFVIARTRRREVALIVDRASGVIEARPDDADALTPDMRRSTGVLSVAEGLVYIEDLEQFLTAEEDAALEAALRAAEERCKSTP
jgi:purine-binding chemotaxis protein CheW